MAKSILRQITPDKFNSSFSQGTISCRQCGAVHKLGLPADFTSREFQEFARQHLGHSQEGGGW